MNIFPEMNEVKEYISMPLIIITESDNVMDMVENGDLYKLVEKWKELYKNNYKPIMYKISLEDFNDLNSYIYIETFVLPPLPFQKWTMITINREGRRFDIYYNSTLYNTIRTNSTFPRITTI